MSAGGVLLPVMGWVRPSGCGAASGAVAARCARRWGREAASRLARARDRRVRFTRMIYGGGNPGPSRVTWARALRAVEVHADEHARRCAGGWL